MFCTKSFIWRSASV